MRLAEVRLKNILTILILVFFSIYAASPLARTLQPDPARQAGTATERPAASIYVVHFLLSSLFEDGSDDVAAGRMIRLRTFIWSGNTGQFLP